MAQNPADPTQLDIEQRKLELEERRVRVEERRADQGKWTRLGIVVPLIAAVLVFGGNFVAQRLQARDALAAEKRQARDAFELKVAELIMDSDGPYETRGRAVALTQLFPNRVPNDFSKNYDPEDATNLEHFRADQVVASKKELVALMAAHPEDAAFIGEIWQRTFPGDTWATHVVPPSR